MPCLVELYQRLLIKRQSILLLHQEYQHIKTSTSPKGEEVGPGIKQLLGKAQYLEFDRKQVVNQIG